MISRWGDYPKAHEVRNGECYDISGFLGFAKGSPVNLNELVDTRKLIVFRHEGLQKDHAGPVNARPP